MVMDINIGNSDIRIEKTSSEHYGKKLEMYGNNSYGICEANKKV